MFDLDSRPSSGKVIYLDVDGHTTTGPYWNSEPGFQPIGGALRQPGRQREQRDAIYEIWQRVSEDYLPFDVNVTTRDPGVDGLRKTSAADQNYGQRMVISPTNWAAGGTLGIALLDVFDESDSTTRHSSSPAASARVIAEAVSHEAGHTLGLRHDGTTTGAEYYDGHGDLGADHGSQHLDAALITQWSRGEYANANNREDDVVDIATYAGFRDDDHAGDRDFATLVGRRPRRTASSAPAATSTCSPSTSGPVRSRSRSVRAWPTASNLHAQVTVRDPSGDVRVGPARRRRRLDLGRVAVEAQTQGRYTVEVRSTLWLTPIDRLQHLWLDGGLPAPGERRRGGAGAACTTSAAGDLGFTSVTPTRLLDTRTGEGGSRRIRAGRQITMQVGGRVVFRRGHGCRPERRGRRSGRRRLPDDVPMHRRHGRPRPPSTS